MAARPLTLTLPRSAPLAAAGLLSGAVVGAALAVQAPLGVALLMAITYAPIAALNLRLAIALWVPLAFLEGVPALNLAGKAAGLLLLGAWVGALRAGIAEGAVLRVRRPMVEALVLLNVWLTLSLLWSSDVARALDDIWHWWAVALVFALVATTLTTAASLRTLAVLFVVGGTLSVLVGVADGDLTRSTTAAATARLGSTAGDPNFLAVGLVAAMAMAAALLVSTQSAPIRFLLVLSLVVMAGGIVASQSRGGMVAAAGTALAAVVFFRRRRTYAIAFILLAVGAAGAWFSVNPHAWERITQFNNGGSGRSDLWTVAWRVFEDHPIVGVGINNFAAVSADYVREPGSLERVALIAEKPHFVHNVYLQMLAESGIIGLGLFMVVVLACLGAAWSAGRIFERLREPGMEALARAVLVGGIGLMTGAFFISSQVDRRLWVLLALGPAMLLCARRMQAASMQEP